MLPLDDPRWLDLDHRNWSGGEGGPDAPIVPDELRHLVASPTDRDRFAALWPYLCSEGTAWPAAYAAVPHLVDIARHLPAAERDEYLYVVGLIAICSGAYGQTPDKLPADITTAYRQALPEALTLLTETLASPHDHLDTRYLLAATAALKGHTALADVLNDLDVFADCQSCGQPMIEIPDDPATGHPLASSI
jgi:enamine deaminase RidA (YjgF/YER057c/UK114 family)